MQSIPREWVEFLRQQFPKDSHIRLTEMGADPRPLPPAAPGNWTLLMTPGSSM